MLSILTRISAAALFLLTAPATQGLPVQARDPASEAWLAFVERHGDGWKAAWSKATGTPKAIWGPGLRVQDRPVRSLDRARALAGATLDRHHGLLGLGASRYVEQIATRQRQLFVFVYEQRFGGLPVIGGRADVRLHDTGVVSMFGSQAVPVPADFDTTPTLGALHARAIAHTFKALDAAEPANAPGRGGAGEQLVVWADVDAGARTLVRLAWEVDIDRRQREEPVVGRVYVDAHTGAVLQYEDDVYTCWFGHRHAHDAVDHGSPDARAVAACPAPPAALSAAPKPTPRARRADIIGTVQGWTNLGLRPWEVTLNVPLPNIEVSVQGVGTTFTDQSGNFRIPHTGQSPVTVTVTMVGRRVGSMTNSVGQTLTQSVQATPGVPVTIQFLNSSAQAIQYSQTTAYWMTDDINEWTRGRLGNTGQLDRLDNVGVTVNIPQSCNAFYTRNTINFYQASQSCYNTAYSTVVYHEWGHGLDNEYGGISRADGISEGWADVVAILRTQQPIVGEDFFFSGRDVRDARNDLTFPQTGSVHRQGQTWMGYCWDVRENLVATVGQSQAETLVTQLFLGSLPANARNQPDGVREVFLLDDNDGNLNNGTPHYNELAQAAVKRRLPFPRVNFGTVTHTPLDNTDQQLAPRIVRAQAVAAQGSWTRAHVAYDDGQSAARQQMVPGSLPNELIALIPGFLSPQEVRYHLEVEHSTGWIERVPETGELSYFIGREVVHLLDDFESGNQGWTSNRSVGVDDWQMGTPGGGSGTSSGITWRDPQGGFSGQNAWGNDLSSGDGAYPIGTVSWLSAPTLNLGLHSGVNLTYRRWLSVEDGNADQAEILVNGQTVWSNPVGEHFGDSDWVEHRLPLPQADQNPNVQIDWKLSTDGSIELGGWTIDDVKVSSFNRLPPPDVKYTVTPPQIGLGATADLLIEGQRFRPMAILLSTDPGPTNLPGLPTIHVGGNIIVAPGFFDGNGRLAFSFTAPNDPQAIGALWYSQSAMLTQRNALAVSNAMILLFGP